MTTSSLSYSASFLLLLAHPVTCAFIHHAVDQVYPAWRRSIGCVPLITGWRAVRCLLLNAGVWITGRQRLTAMLHMWFLEGWRDTPTVTDTWCDETAATTCIICVSRLSLKIQFSDQDLRISDFPPFYWDTFAIAACSVIIIQRTSVPCAVIWSLRWFLWPRSKKPARCQVMTQLLFFFFFKQSCAAKIWLMRTDRAREEC